MSTSAIPSTPSPKTNIDPTMKPLFFLTRTDNSSAPLVARLALGLVMFPHGAGKFSLDSLVADRAGRN